MADTLKLRADGETINLEYEEAQRVEKNMKALRTVQMMDSYIMRADYDSNGRIIYQGFAEPGTATSTAGWLIIKFTYEDTDATFSPSSKLFADGNTQFDNIWDDRASLNIFYS